MIPDQTKPSASQRYWRALQYPVRIPVLYLKRRGAVRRCPWLDGEPRGSSWRWAVRYFHLWVWGQG
jgi:hypothetical protein